jgi:hypothetical protein
MIARVRTEELDVNKKRIEQLCEQVTNQGANHNPMVLVELIKEIVPEYISQNSVFEQLDKIN